MEESAFAICTRPEAEDFNCNLTLNAERDEQQGDASMEEGGQRPRGPLPDHRLRRNLRGFDPLPPPAQ